jgi:hypothetical protein
MERFETLLHDVIVCRDDVKQLRVLSSGQNRARQVAIGHDGSGRVKACLSTADIIQPKCLKNYLHVKLTFPYLVKRLHCI